MKSLTSAVVLVLMVFVTMATVHGCSPASNDVSGINASPTPRPGPTPVAHKCGNGYCYIRSANVCCPSGSPYFSGAGCYATLQGCQNGWPNTPGNSKCYYETTCIP